MKKFVFTFLLVVFATTVVSAQRTSDSKKSPLSSYKLLDVKVAGATRYTAADILLAAGLQLGQNVTEADFRDAVRLLGDSGLFTDVSYSYTYAATGAKLELKLADIDQSKLVPVHFENFVWFTDSQLVSELRKRVPLFQLQLPPSGSFPDRVGEALQTLLNEKQIPGRVDYLREANLEGSDTIIGIAYAVEDMDIRIRNVEFPGAGPDLQPGLEAPAKKLGGARYMRSPLGKVAEVDFLPVCLKHGYLKAAFAPSDAHVVTQSGSDVEVDTILALNPGKVYSTSGVNWKGNSVFKAEELEKLLHLPAGQPADAVRLAGDLEKVEQLYHTRGYMAVKVTPAPTFDEDRSTVHYDLNVVEGDQFKMGEIEIHGLDTQTTSSLQGAWTLREGEPYNGDYPAQFIQKNLGLLPRGVRWTWRVQEGVNASDKTVDVTIRFSPE